MAEEITKNLKGLSYTLTKQAPNFWHSLYHQLAKSSIPSASGNWKKGTEYFCAALNEKKYTLSQQFIKRAFAYSDVHE